MKQLTIMLGAGFSAAAGSPLTGALFDGHPPVFKEKDRRIVEAASQGWARWRTLQAARKVPKIEAEEFLKFVYEGKDDLLGVPPWSTVVQFLGLRLAWIHADRGVSSFDRRPWGADVTSASTGPVHEAFWDTIFRNWPADMRVVVVTTNYDLWAERGLRWTPRPRKLRPGFNYGLQGEFLQGYASFPRRATAFPELRGTVPVLKLHGSLSWEVHGGERVAYVTCRPAFQGNAAIVPPLSPDERPDWLSDIWAAAEKALRATTVLLVVGYSLPEYDREVRRLLSENLDSSRCGLALYSARKSAGYCDELRRLVPGLTVRELGKLPDSIREIGNALRAQSML
jgi:hypothetical protein